MSDKEPPRQPLTAGRFGWTRAFRRKGLRTQGRLKTRARASARRRRARRDDLPAGWRPGKQRQRDRPLGAERVFADGARQLFLPKRSPDLNPIEQVFAKLKGFVRKAAARTFNAVSDALADALAQFSLDECASYLTNAGYAHA